jgi:hypothetical protein
MQAAIDPVLLLSPAGRLAQVDEWILRVSALAELLADSPLSGSCPEYLQDLAQATWWAQYGEMGDELKSLGSPFTMNELLQVWEQLRGRLAGRALADDRSVLYSDLEVRPKYAPPIFAVAEHEAFVDHLGDLALLRRDDGEPGLVLTVEESWAAAMETIEVTGQIAVLADESGHEKEPTGEAASLRELLIGCTTIEAARQAIANHPWRLVHHPELAIQLAWTVHSGGDVNDLDFRVADGFSETLVRMGYNTPAESAHVASCWRAMAYIAARRAGDLGSLEAHAHKKGGAGAPPVKDDEGRVLYRGAVFMGSNAHRLFWWAGDVPEFVGVAGHDDKPPV